MPGLVDAANSIANSIGIIGAAARQSAADVVEAREEVESFRSTMAGMSGDASSTGGMGATSGSSGSGGAMTAGGLTMALQSLTRRR